MQKAILIGRVIGITIAMVFVVALVALTQFARSCYDAMRHTWQQRKIDLPQPQERPKRNRKPQNADRVWDKEPEPTQEPLVDDEKPGLYERAVGAITEFYDKNRNDDHESKTEAVPAFSSEDIERARREKDEIMNRIPKPDGDKP